MQSSDQFRSSSSDNSDDEEEDGGWLAHSTFDINNPPVSARHHSTDRRPLSSNAFDVSMMIHSPFFVLLNRGAQDTFDPRDTTNDISDPFRVSSDDVGYSCIIMPFNALPDV
jgi:hypothetical protein